jgi:hypothetical protein
MAGATEDDNIRQPPHYREGGPPQVVTADTARQGPSGWRVLIVLVVGLIAAGIAWVVFGQFYGHM